MYKPTLDKKQKTKLTDKEWSGTPSTTYWGSCMKVATVGVGKDHVIDIYTEDDVVSNYDIKLIVTPKVNGQD